MVSWVGILGSGEEQVFGLGVVYGAGLWVSPAGQFLEGKMVGDGPVPCPRWHFRAAITLCVPTTTSRWALPSPTSLELG